MSDKTVSTKAEKTEKPTIIKVVTKKEAIKEGAEALKMNDGPVVKLPNHDITEISFEKFLESIKADLSPTLRYHTLNKNLPALDVLVEGINNFKDSGANSGNSFDYFSLSKAKKIVSPIKFYKAVPKEGNKGKLATVYFDSTSSIKYTSNSSRQEIDAELEEDVPRIRSENKGESILYVINSDINVSDVYGTSVVMSTKIGTDLSINSSAVIVSHPSYFRNYFTGVAVKAEAVNMTRSVLINSHVTCNKNWNLLRFERAVINDSTLRGSCDIKESRILNTSIYSDSIRIRAVHFEDCTFPFETVPRLSFFARYIAGEHRTFKVVGHRLSSNNFEELFVGKGGPDSSITICHPMHHVRLNNVFTSNRDISLLAVDGLGLLVSPTCPGYTSKESFLVSPKDSFFDIRKKCGTFFGIEKPDQFDGLVDQSLENESKILTDILVSRMNALRLLDRFDNNEF